MIVDPPADTSLSISDRIAHDTPILLDMMAFLTGGQGRSAELPSGFYIIDKPLEYLVTEDRRANIAIVGRRTSIRQVDDTKPVFDLGTTKGNLRGIEMSSLILTGGAAGIRTNKTVYNNFNDIEISHTVGDAAIQATDSNDTYMNCWIVHTDQAAFIGINGNTKFSHTRFGEDCGSLRQVGGVLNLSGCHGHSLKSASPWNPDELPAWLYAFTNSTIIVDGGRFELNDDVIFAEQFNGGQFQMSGVTVL